MPRERTNNVTPPLVLWAAYAAVGLGFVALAAQLPWPEKQPAGPSPPSAETSVPPSSAPPAGPRAPGVVGEIAPVARETGASPAPQGPMEPAPRMPPPPEPATRPTPQAEAARAPAARLISPSPVAPARPRPAVAPPPVAPRPPAAVTPARPRPEPAADASPPARPARSPRNVRRGNPDLRQVLLSFDGGGGANSAASILQALERRRVRTTFFLTGRFIREHPDLAREIVAAGHEVGNHMDRHAHLTTWESDRTHRTRPGVDREFIQRELRSTEEAFRAVTGGSLAPLWRAPYGEVNREILSWAAESGYEHVGWTGGFDSLDWVEDASSPRYRSPTQFLAEIAQRVAREPAKLNGAILLMHLDSGRPAAQRIAGRAADLMTLLQEAGYELVPASTLLRNLLPGDGSPDISR